MRRSFIGDRRGSVITVFAFAAMVLAVLTAVVMNQVTFYTAKRKLQAAVDMTALMIMESGDLTAAKAKALLEEQLNSPIGTVTVTRGNYTADASVSEESRFNPLETPYNAVEVRAEVSGDAAMFAGMLPAGVTMDAKARAARRTSATVTVGSRLVRIEGGLSAALLDATLGYKGKLTIADYESLASAKVDALQYLKALNVKADIKAVRFDQVLSAPVSVGEVVDAFAATTSEGKVIALLSKASPVSGLKDIKVGEVVDLGTMSGLPIDALLSGQTVPLSVGEVLAGSAALSDKDHQIAINLASVLGDPGIANASLYVGEKPKTVSYLGRAAEGAEVETSQIRLDIGALGLNPLTAIKVDVSLANAEIEIDDIKCKSDGSAEVIIKAKTEAASVGVKASILPRIPVKLASDETKKLTFSKADIDAQTYKPVRSGMGLQLGGLSVAQKLLFNPVDSLLEKLGLHIAEADVKVSEATCGEVGLVH